MTHEDDMNLIPQESCADPANAPWKIGLVAASILILELCFIRLIPAEVRAISYFTNLILMAAFFGIGTGCILSEQRSTALLLPVGLALVFLFIFIGRGIVIYEEAKQVHYWLQYANIPGQARKIPLFQAAAILFVLCSLPFITLGQTLAQTMSRFPRLTAYGWDIAGSLCGTLVFAASSLLHLPPWVWPPVITVVWAIVFGRSWALRTMIILSGTIFLTLSISPYPSKWSPYYYVQSDRLPIGTQVWVNSTFHQLAIDFSSDDPTHADFRKTMLDKWNRPYEMYRALHNGQGPERVLVLGAGTGNDVTVALANGASDITAVEIDPMILELGRTANKSQPYSDPRVHTVVDDARHFLHTSKEQFDLIVFGTLDSITLLGGQANLRLESYVYTEESLNDAKQLLRDDGGMVAIYYSVFKPWLWERLYTTLRHAFGEQSTIHFESSQELFNTVLIATKGRDDFHDTAENVMMFGRGSPATDDWPFIFLEFPTIAPIYWKLFSFILVLIIGVFALLRRVHPAGGLHLNFLFLGLGFTLMEASAITRLSLLFGSTWVVNVVVFSAVLLTIFLANWAVLKEKAPPLRLAWPGVIVFIFLNYCLPISSLFSLPVVARVLSCGLLIGIPVFFAAVCFSRLFEKQPTTGYPLGINLIGAMAGGMLEYVSMVVGMRAVWAVAMVIYLLAWLTTATSKPASRSN